MSTWRQRWRVSARAFVALITNPQDTDKVFDFMSEIDPNSLSRLLHRAQVQWCSLNPRQSPPWQTETLRTRVSQQLSPISQPSDSQTLMQAYQQFVNSNQIKPDGLIRLWQHRTNYPSCQHQQRFLHRHLIIHDLLHVITEYGACERGELQVLAFSFGQEGGFGNLLLAVLGTLAGHAAPSDVWRAYRRGRQASWIFTLPLERYLDQPLRDVRALARV